MSQNTAARVSLKIADSREELCGGKLPFSKHKARGQREGVGKTAGYLKCPYLAFLLDLTLSLLEYKVIVWVS